MIGRLPHPTKTGEFADYDLDKMSMPMILTAWFDEMERIIEEGPVREFARERLVAIVYSLQTRQLRHVADELERVADVLRDNQTSRTLASRRPSDDVAA